MGVYDLEYKYDQGGNRTRKIDHFNDFEIVHTYDTSDPGRFNSANNRLMYVDRVEPIGGAIVERTFYFYNVFGNVTRIVSNTIGTDDYSSTWLSYARNGSTVVNILGETWTWDGIPGNAIAGYTVTFGREFRYDRARQRYLNRELDVAQLNLDPPKVISASDTWSDYDGDRLYGDYTSDGQTFSEHMAFEPGLGRFDMPYTGGAEEYYHTDQLGTTRAVSDANGMLIDSTVFTAFGEPISGPGQRLGYAGAHGYQGLTNDGSAPGPGALNLLHLGHRYYDSVSARFLQRDRIGIIGGLNVYLYAIANPLMNIDPFGLSGQGLLESHARHEGALVLWSYGMMGAAVGELTCSAIGLGWIWGTDRFRTGDLFRAVRDAANKVGGHSSSSSSSPPPSPPPPRPNIPNGGGWAAHLAGYRAG